MDGGTAGADRYRILAGPGSPYSHKVRTAMRYRRISHDWVVVLGGFDGTGQTARLARLGKSMFPIVQFPDGGAWTDSTPILHELEARHPGERSVLPSSPGDRFLARLIEDFADEWLPLPLMALRWTSDVDVAFCARRQMHGWLGAVDEAALAAGVERFTARQRKLRTILGADRPEALPVLERHYVGLLDVLESGLSRQLFLFGERPSIADFALYGMLSQFAIDPTASALLRARAVRLFQWTHYADDLSGHDGEWQAAGGAANPTVRALVALAGRSLLPMLQAMAGALARGEPLARYAVDGVALQRMVLPYPVTCWLWLKQMFAALPYGERAALRPLLEETGFWQALAFVPGEAERVPPFAMI